MYSHIIELPDYLQEKVRSRLDALQAELNRQDDDVQALFKGFQEELLSDEDLEEGFLYVLFSYLNSERVLTMDDMMAGPVGRFVRYILSADYYRMFEEFLKIEEHCAATYNCACVPAGGRRPLLHVNALDWAIKDFFALDVSELDDEDLLYSCVVEESADGEEWYMPETADIITEWLTVKVASGDQTVIGFMADELDEEDYSDVSCQLFITSILKSANHQLLRSVVNLFLHQEDYYESFVSDVFELLVGIAPKSMLFLIDSMKENEQLNAVMGSSMFVMLFPQMDLGVEEAPNGDILHVAADCLRNPAVRKQLLADNNPQKVYVALWAIGFYNTDEAWDEANKLISDGRALSKEVVLTYYRNHWAKQSLEVITQRIEQQQQAYDSVR